MSIARTILSDFYIQRLANLEMIIRDLYEDLPRVMPQIFNERNMKGSMFKTSGYSGLNLYSEVGEGVDIPTDDPVQGFDAQFIPLKHGSGFKMTAEMMDDDLDEIAKDFTTHLGNSEVQTQETQAATLFNNGFSGGTAIPDGEQFFSGSHPLAKAGGTWRNQPSTSADLSITSLEQAMIDMADWVSDAGLKIAIRPRILLIPTELWWLAQRLLNSEQLPQSANNDINPARDFVTPIKWEYLTDSDAFFLGSDKNMHKLFWAWKLKGEFGRQFNEKNQTLEVYRTYRAIQGVSDARGWYGSPGA